MRSKDLRTKRVKLVEDARALLNEDGTYRDAEAEARYDAIMAEVDQMKAQIDRLDRQEAAEHEQLEMLRARGERSGTSAEELHEQDGGEAGAFRAWMRHGLGGLDEAQRAVYQRRFQAAQGVGTNSEGGYLVPQGFYQHLEDARKAYGGMAAVATPITTDSGNALPMPTDNDTSNSGAILSENTQAGTQDVTFGTVTLGAYTYTSKIVLVSNQLLQDSAFDLDAFLGGKLGVRIARAINNHFTVGTGSSQPNGAVTAATSGKAGASGQATSLIFDDLIDLEHSVDPAYRTGPKVAFMLHDTTVQAVKKLKDSQGRYLWQPAMPVAGTPDMIDNKPYVINQDMPVMAASAKSVLFGDFSKYFIRQVTGTLLMRLVERYADYNQTGFVAFQRWDGNLVDAGTHPLKYYANSAS